MLEDNVHKVYPKDAAKNPDNVLEQAIGEFEHVFILGWDKNGDFDARASLGLSEGDLFMLAEIFKYKLLNGEFDD